MQTTKSLPNTLIKKSCVQASNAKASRWWEGSRWSWLGSDFMFFPPLYLSYLLANNVMILSATYVLPPIEAKTQAALSRVGQAAGTWRLCRGEEGINIISRVAGRMQRPENCRREGSDGMKGKMRRISQSHKLPYKYILKNIYTYISWEQDCLFIITYPGNDHIQAGFFCQC